MIRKVPFNNRDLEKEKLYLEKKIKEGFKLKKKQYNTYFFEKVLTNNGAVEIDIFHGKPTKEKIEIVGLEVLTLSRLGFSKFYQVIYYKQDSNNYFTFDEHKYLQLYNFRYVRLERLMFICFLLMPYIAVTDLLDISILRLPPLFFLIYPPLFIYVLIAGLKDAFIFKRLKDRLGYDIEFDIDPFKSRYFITISCYNSSQHKELSEQLTRIGKVIGSENDFHLIVSKISSVEEILVEVCRMTELTEEEVKVVRQLRAFTTEIMG